MNTNHPHDKFQNSNKPQLRNDANPSDVNFCQRKRYLVALLTIAGYMVTQLAFANFSVAMVQMADKEGIESNETFDKNDIPRWNNHQISLLVSSYNWGHFMAPIVGILVEKFDGVSVYGIFIASTGILSLVTPIFINLHFLISMALRIAQGIAVSIQSSAITHISINWIPFQERSRFGATLYCGCGLSVAMWFSICGLIGQLYGWKAIFYVTGLIPLFWALIWFIVVRDSPSKDKRISEIERKYLNAHTVNTNTKKKNYGPWKDILKSKPVWAYANLRFVESFTNSFTMQLITLYISSVANVNIEKMGFLSSLPILMASISLILAGFLSDHLRSTLKLSATNAHRVTLLTAQASAIISNSVLAFSSTFTLCILSITIGRMGSILTFVSYATMPIDIGGCYGSQIAAFCVIFSGIGLTINPLIVSLLVPNLTITEWRRYFLLLIGLNTYSGIMYLLFGSGELQPWAQGTDTIDEEPFAEKFDENELPSH